MCAVGGGRKRIVEVSKEQSSALGGVLAVVFLCFEQDLIFSFSFNSKLACIIRSVCSRCVGNSH